MHRTTKQSIPKETPAHFLRWQASLLLRLGFHLKWVRLWRGRVPTISGDKIRTWHSKHARTHARTHAHLCTYARTHAHSHAHTHTYARTHAHARAHTHTRAHVRTHANTRRQVRLVTTNNKINFTVLLAMNQTQTKLYDSINEVYLAREQNPKRNEELETKEQITERYSNTC